MKIHLSHLSKALAVTAIMTGSLTLAAPAHAINAQGDIISTKVDLRDLKTERGVERVYKALSRRADIACKTPGMKPFSMRKAENDCAQNLLTDFVEDVNHPRLTKYHSRMQS